MLSLLVALMQPRLGFNYFKRAARDGVQALGLQRWPHNLAGGQSRQYCVQRKKLKNLDAGSSDTPPPRLQVIW